MEVLSLLIWMMTKRKKRKIVGSKGHYESNFHFIFILACSPAPPVEKKRKLGKNPMVDTSFLPDRDREVSPQVM